MKKRTYTCPACGAVTVITQKEADESKVLLGEIPAFVWCMKCPDKKHHYERIRVWGEGVTDRVVTHYSIIGTRGHYGGFNRATRRRLQRELKKK